MQQENIVQCVLKKKKKRVLSYKRTQKKIASQSTPLAGFHIALTGSAAHAKSGVLVSRGAWQLTAMPMQQRQQQNRTLRAALCHRQQLGRIRLTGAKENKIVHVPCEIKTVF